MQRSKCFCFAIRAYQNGSMARTGQAAVKSFHSNPLMSTNIPMIQTFHRDYSSIDRGHRSNLLNQSILPVNSFIGKRGMASKKAKNKKKGAGAKVSSKIDTSIGDGIYDLKTLKAEMDTCTQKFKEELTKKYCSDLTIGIIDNFHVTINGDTTALYEIAEVTAQDNEFIITPMIKGKNIEKQIIDSINTTGLNLNPKIIDKTISINKPISSTDYKTNLLKLSKSSGEKSKVIIRKIRQQSMSKIKKLKDASKDEIKLLEKQVDLIYEASVNNIDQLIDKKKSELKL